MLKRIFLILPLFFVFINTVCSQETGKSKELSVGHELSVIVASKIVIPVLVPPPPPPSRWNGGTLLQLGFSQLSLTNWASGGFDNIALNAYVNIYKNYTYEQMFWENRLQLAYGFIQSFGDRYKKSDDKFIFDSKVGYKAYEKVFASASFNLRTQIANGFTYPANADPKLVSAPLAPAYFSLGVGLDYKPAKPISINFSPLTGNLVVVRIPELRTRYGNKADQGAKLELGAQMKIEYKDKVFKNTNVTTTLNFFSDYLGTPKNIKVYWDLLVDSKINKFFSVNLRTNLIYDDDILIADNDGNLAPRLQLKEIFSIGFSYTFGNFKK